MNETVIFSDVERQGPLRMQSINAIAEVDGLGHPFSAEVPRIVERLGGDARTLFETLKRRGIAHSYSEEVDALTLSFGDGLRSWGQARGVLQLTFDDFSLVELRVHERP